jgi:hypothetical protein
VTSKFNFGGWENCLVTASHVFSKNLLGELHSLMVPVLTMSDPSFFRVSNMVGACPARCGGQDTSRRGKSLASVGLRSQVG